MQVTPFEAGDNSDEPIHPSLLENYIGESDKPRHLRHPSPSSVAFLPTSQKHRLTEEQATAVQPRTHNVAVLASAGSGKSHTLAVAVDGAVSSGISPERILVITFSNEGVRALKQKLDAIAPTISTKVNIRTIHSLALSLVGTNRPGIQVLSEIEAAKLLEESAKRFGFGGNDLETLQSIRTSAINRQEALEDVASERDELSPRQVVAALQAYDKAKVRAGRVDFEDMLFQCEQMLRDNVAVRSSLQARFDHVFVDEAQDTSAIQWAIINFVGRPIFAVGDPNQAIYGFRGCVADFQACLGKAERFALTETFRCSPEIVAVANLVIETPTRTQQESGPVPVVSEAPDLVHEALLVSNFVLEHLKSGRTVAVLARRWDQLTLVDAALRLMGSKPLSDGFRPLPETKEFLRLLVAYEAATSFRSSPWERLLAEFRLANPKYEELLSPGLFDPFDAIADVDLRDLVREVYCIGTRNPKITLSLSDFYVIFENTRLRSHHRFFVAFCQLCDAIKIPNVSAIENQWLATLDRCLTLSTIHSQKGAEFDAVAIVGLNEGSFPDERNLSSEEERRLFYVGVTRAKRQLLLSYPAIGCSGRRLRASDFVIELTATSKVEEVPCSPDLDHLSLELLKTSQAKSANLLEEDCPF